MYMYCTHTRTHTYTTEADMVSGICVNLCTASKHQGWTEDSLSYNEEEIVNLALTPGFPWGNTMIQEVWRGLQYANSVSLPLSLSLSLSLSAPLFSPWWYRHTTKSAWMKGASNGHWFLIGNFLHQHGAWPESRLRFGQGHHVWEHQLERSLSGRHQMNRRSRTQGSESSGSLLSSLGD